MGDPEQLLKSRPLRQARHNGHYREVMIGGGQAVWACLDPVDVLNQHAAFAGIVLRPHPPLLFVRAGFDQGQYLKSPPPDGSTRASCRASSGDRLPGRR